MQIVVLEQRSDILCYLCCKLMACTFPLTNLRKCTRLKLISFKQSYIIQTLTFNERMHTCVEVLVKSRETIEHSSRFNAYGFYNIDDI